MVLRYSFWVQPLSHSKIQSRPQERSKGAQLSRAIDDERKGLPKVHVLDESEGQDAKHPFWNLLGTGAIKSAEEGGSDEEAEKKTDRRLFQLSDASGSLSFKEIATGNNIKKSQLDENDVFIFDTGVEVFAW